MKTVWKPGNLVVPAPAAMVSCGRGGETPNIITVAWCGNINTNPAMLSISIQPSRYSHGIIVDTGEFVVNIPSRRQAWAVDYCGVVSGRDVDKFAAAALTPLTFGSVSCPGVEECPIAIACRTTQRLSLGSHDLFLAQVEEVAVDERLMDKSGRFQLEKAELLCYAHGHYYSLGARQGHFGWSVRKKKGGAGKRQ